MMEGRLVRVTAATALPFTLADAKEHLKVEHDDDDARIAGLIAAALESLQPPTGWLGRSLCEQTLRLDLPGWPWARRCLPAGPVLAINSVKYFDVNNIEQTLDSSLYFQDGDELLLTSAFSGQGLYCRPGAVRIEYRAGYATELVGEDEDDVEEIAQLPAPIVQAIKKLVWDWYEAPGAAQASPGAPLPYGVEHLLSPFRLYS